MTKQAQSGRANVKLSLAAALSLLLAAIVFAVNDEFLSAGLFGAAGGCFVVELARKATNTDWVKYAGYALVGAGALLAVWSIT